MLKDFFATSAELFTKYTQPLIQTNIRTGLFERRKLLPEITLSSNSC